MTPEQILKTISTGESEALEFKTSFDREVIETLTAFSNTGGGTVLVGVADNGEVRGIDLGKESLQDWLNRIKVSTIPSLFPDAEKVSLHGKTLVRLVIAEHPIKPVSCKGKYFRRSKNSNHQMSIQGMLSGKSAGIIHFQHCVRL